MVRSDNLVVSYFNILIFLLCNILFVVAARLFSHIIHFRITGHGFLLKILLRDIKSVTVNKSSVPKITSQPRNFATSSIQSSDHFSGQNCPTFSACKIVNFCPSHLKFWNDAFQTVYFTTLQKQIWLHMYFKEDHRFIVKIAFASLLKCSSNFVIESYKNVSPFLMSLKTWNIC